MKNLTEGNIYKTFFLFAVPLVLSGLLTQAYNITDTVIAGKFIGTEGLAATGATSALVTLFSAVFWGYITAFAIYAATIFGAREYVRLKRCIFSNLIIISLVIIFFSLIIVLFKNQIFDFLRLDESIRDSAAIYFVIYMGGIIFILLNHFGLSVMNALGASSYPFFMSIVSMILNICGNIFTIVVLKWGAAGIAFSSVLSALVVDACYFFKLKRCFSELGCDSEKTGFSAKTVKKTLPYSIPGMFQQITMYLPALIVAPFVNGIGGYATAAYTVVMRIFNINAAIYQNASKTLSNHSAQCVGAGKRTRLMHGLWAGLIQGVLFTLPAIMVCVLLPRQICALFFKKGHSGADFESAVVFARFYLPFIIFNLLNNLFHAFYRGIRLMLPLIVFTLIGSVTNVISSIILIKIYGMNGFYMGLVISWVAEFIFSFIFYLSGKWKNVLP